MSDKDNRPPKEDTLERTLQELFAADGVLDGKNGRHFQSVVEELLAGLTCDQQLTTKLMAETRMGFGMALGKFLAWRTWTEIEKSDKQKSSSKVQDPVFTLRTPSEHLGAVKSAWPSITTSFYRRVGFFPPEFFLEPYEDDGWALEKRGGLLEVRRFSEDWEQSLLQFLVDHAPSMLSLGLVKEMVEKIKLSDPVIAEEVERLRLPVTTPFRVLRALLEDGIAVHELETILTAVILQVEQGADRAQLLSAVRAALSPWICKGLQSAPGVLRVIRLGPKIEEIVAESVRYFGVDPVYALDHGHRTKIAWLLRRVVEDWGDSRPLVLLTDLRTRQEFATTVRAEGLGLTVLTASEIPNGFKIEIVAVVDFANESVETLENS